MNGGQESTNSQGIGDYIRPKFGQRFLRDGGEVYSHNAWDNVSWTAEQMSQASSQIAENSADVLPNDIKELHAAAAADYWDKFYAQHQDKFFKDRSWISAEFPELFASTSKKCCYFYILLYTDGKIFEVGCGVGNTTIPILRGNTTKNFFLYTSDFSSNAIELLKKSPEYDPFRCHAFTFDITKTDTVLPFTTGSIDIIVMIFVLSAISPDEFYTVLKNLASYLKPGGLFLFRDYGREELRQLFSSCGLEEVENILDRRLIVNRKKELKMYRVWIQCKYKKPICSLSFECFQRCHLNSSL
ncbi:Methyltransferase protein 2 [Fasciolopsis buskii]|uniref:tRNA N(3)-methylcytidine methyltransferase n=1 Tax=Fasciolopsis buskii TaxID=27845 RepID=A0A8E0RJM9_9TREM|nr:Methyltransferase protein 2 [Fasciolopsis buski]